MSVCKPQFHIKDIVADHWDHFKKVNKHKVPTDLWDSVEESVSKMLSCGEIENGFARYVCPDCLKDKVVAFTCKSRFCNRCGKVYIDNWVEKTVGNIIDVGHRHTVFSIPEELRSYFYWNRDLLKDLSDCAAQVIQHYYEKKNKSLEYQVGIIAVVHTFGRDMKFNPHIHALATEGALDKNKNWKSVGYIPYDYLRKSWQKVLMDLIKDKFGHQPEVRRLINDLYKRYPHGFYVHAATRMRDARGAAGYIGRYLARPAIAEYRIINYDGQRVRFWYKDHQTGKRTEVETDAIDFIGRLTMHIPKKQFKMVRRYGLYRRNLNKLAQQVVQLHNFIKTRNTKRLLALVQQKQQKLSWKERIVANFGENPLRCRRCGTEMVLWYIWHPKYGYLYDISRDHPEVRLDERRPRLGYTGNTLSRQQPLNVLQLSLSEMCV